MITCTKDNVPVKHVVMNIASSIILGCFAFLFMAFIDWAMLLGYPWLKPLLLLCACVCFFIGFSGVLSFNVGESSSGWLKILGWICIFLFGSLLIYSIFIEIPLKSTYLGSSESQDLVDTGTYALTRHPGVLWFTGFTLGLCFIRPAALTALAGGVWLLADVLLVVVEDHYFFPKTIPRYSTYKQTTPFLWPTRKSLGRFKSSFGASGGNRH